MKKNIMRLLVASLVLILGATTATVPAHAAPPKLTVTVKAKPVSVTRSQLTVSVKIRAKKQRPTVLVRIKAGKKSIKVRARYKAGHYRAKTTISKSKAKKVVVRVLGIKKSQRIKKTAAKAIARVLGGAGTGKRISVTTRSGGTPVHLTGTLQPAHGRKVLVQRLRANSWSTQATLHTSKAKKVTWSATLPAMKTTSTWRIHAPATPNMKAATLTTVTITPKGTTGGSDDNSGGDDSDNGGGGTNPPRTWLPGQRYCLDNTGQGYTSGGVYYAIPGQSIPGCTDFGSATIPTISTIMGVKTLDDRCAVTITCWRDPTPYELSRGHDPNKPQKWSPPPAVAQTNGYSTNSETLYVPTLIDELNAFAVEEGWITQTEVDQHGPAFRYLPDATGSWGGFPSMSAPGHGLIPGQGGPAQEWVDIVANGRSFEKIWMNADGGTPRYSTSDGEVDTNMNFTQLPSVIGRHSPSRALPVQGNWRSNRMDTIAPMGNPDYRWSCGEQTWSLTGSLRDTMNYLDPPHYNDFKLDVLHYIERGYQGPYYMTVGGKRWPNGHGWIILTECLVSEQVGTEYYYHSLPGDPHA